MARLQMASAAGEDARLLRDHEIFGFGTDGAAGSFADSSGREVLAHEYRRYLVDQQQEHRQVASCGYQRSSTVLPSGSWT
ncbi:DUF4241 domain-containing protein [Streptomyces sp. NPDC001984]|uniref:DUF4241 domain-containing protein n=1 Tax=Streptomyces sp. NPDC002619 TaxID=3364655 RepID=UPI00367BD2CD